MSNAFALPVDANFSEEQHALADMAGDLFAAINPPSRLRELWDQQGPRDRTVWQRLAEVGITSIGVPESQGGMGGDAQDLALVLEEAGRQLLPEPLAATVAVAVPTLVAAPGHLADRWLPAICAGEATAAISLDGDPFVLDVDDVDFVLVEREKTLWLDDAPAEATRVGSEDGSRRRFRRPDLRGEMLGGADLLEDVRVRAVAASASELIGVCAALVDQCVEYARLRQQFGVAIGSFQAVQHILADMFVRLESARGASRHAALRIAKGEPDRFVQASIAKAAAAEAHRRINTDALQVFGGIGFTWEHDLHLWLKRGLALEAQHGGARDHRRIVADHLFDA